MSSLSSVWKCPSCDLLNDAKEFKCLACFELDPEHTAVNTLRAELSEIGQSHLLHFADALSEDALMSLVSDIRSVDWAEIDSLWKQVLAQRKTDADADTDSGKTVSGFPSDRQFSVASVESARSEWTEVGNGAVVRGECAVVIMAGGQGTRLGATQPKGILQLGFASRKSLFQLHLEKVLKTQRMADATCADSSAALRSATAADSTAKKSGAVIAVYIMTSSDTYSSTLSFLRKFAYFGLESANVRVFKQKEYPCLHPETGGALLASECKVKFAPNGNGGIYASLASSGCLADMRKRGVKQVQVFGVDNVLARVGDSAWFGHCLALDLAVSNKCALKREPEERVGVMCLRSGRPHVVEYSEMDASMQSDAELQCANLCMHSFSLEFLVNECCALSADRRLPIHEAIKAMTVVDLEQSHASGKAVLSQSKGLKMEHFIFDSFAFVSDLKRFSVLNLRRNDEFSAVKNKEGKDSPATARRDLSAFWVEKIMAAGAVVPNYKTKAEESAAECLLCEVSPLVSLAGEGLAFVKGRKLPLPFTIELKSHEPVVSFEDYFM